MGDAIHTTCDLHADVALHRGQVRFVYLRFKKPIYLFPWNTTETGEREIDAVRVAEYRLRHL